MTFFVEFAGCSGAGKSTLRHSVYDRLKQDDVIVRLPLELFLGQRLSRRIHSEPLENLLLDVLVLPWLVLSIPSSMAFLRFAKNAIWARTDRLVLRLLLLRSVMRKIGFTRFLRNRERIGEIVLVDEGPVHSAHVIFVNGEHRDLPDDIDTFATLVPKPDMVIFVDTDLDIVIERTLDRNDPPISDTNSDNLTSFATRAHKLFQKLMKSPAFSNLTVMKLDGARLEAETAVNVILSQMGITQGKKH